VVNRSSHAIFCRLPRRKTRRIQELGHLLHLRRIGARGMQKRAASTVDRAGDVTIKRQNISRAARRIFEIDVCQPLPATAYAQHFTTDFTSAIDNAFDHGIQSGNIAAASEYPDALYGHPSS